MKVVRRLLLGVSLANLLALTNWVILFRPGQEAPLAGVEFAGMVIAVVVLGLGLGALGLLTDLLDSRVRPHVVALGLVLIWGLIFWGGVKPSLHEKLQYLMIWGRGPVFIGCAVVIGPLLLFLCWRCDYQLQLWLTRAAWILSPFLLLTFGQAAWQAWTRGLNVAPEMQIRIPTLQPDRHRARTVLILFDEFDYQLAFDPRVRRDALPALDELRRQAFFATEAYPPMHSTIMSVPAMLTGRLVESGQYRNDLPGDLLLKFAGGGTEAFSAQTTLFTDLRAQGYSSLRMNDALLPHMRLAGHADADFVVVPPQGYLSTLGDYTISNLISFFALVPFSKGEALDLQFGRWLHLPQPSEHVAAVASQIVSLAATGDADFLFLHILLPHLPVVFDPARNGFGSRGSGDYRDNLAGVDAVVNRVCVQLRQSGRWDDTNLIVTSDHFFRFKRATYGIGDHRIPFIVKFAGSAEAAGDFDMAFNTVLVRAMVRDIVRGQVRSPAQLRQWIEAYAEFGESPLTQYRQGW